MRLPNNNYVIPVVVDATLYANNLPSANHKFSLLQTFVLREQSICYSIQKLTVTAKKPLSIFVGLIDIDFQMINIAARRIRKNTVAIYENQRKSMKYLRNKLNYIL